MNDHIETPEADDVEGHFQSDRRRGTGVGPADPPGPDDGG